VPETSGESSEPRDVGGYQVLRLIGEGGMAQVFQARRLGAAGFAREVALKRIRGRIGRDAAFRRMFVDEALLVARLRHPGIAQVYDLIEEPEGYSLVMEYVEGHTLKELMQVASRKVRPLDPDFACHVAIEVAEALHYAHHLMEEGRPLGIVHRDVTPHNLMVATTGEVKLLDFGIAWSCLEGRDRTESGIIKGKTSYMSPEQALGEEQLDGRSDQFSLAIVLVEMLTGHRVFDAGTNEVKTLHRISLASPEDVTAATRHLPKALGSLIGRALARDREARFPSCADFAQALRKYLTTRGQVFGPRQVAAEVARLLSLPDASEEATVSLFPANSPGGTAPLTVPAPVRNRSRQAMLAVLLLALGAAGLLAVRLHAGGPRNASPIQGTRANSPLQEQALRAPLTQETPPVATGPVEAPTPSRPPGRRRSAALTPQEPVSPAKEMPPFPRRSLATPMGTSFMNVPAPSTRSTTSDPDSP
jgi:serine/threonine-protein kinase